MELIEGSETSANKNRTPGKYPKKYIQYSKHGESLKSRILHLYREDIAMHIRRLEKLRIKKITLLSCLTFLLRYWRWNWQRVPKRLQTTIGRRGNTQRIHTKPVWHITLLCVQWKPPDDGQVNCPKLVEFSNVYWTVHHYNSWGIRNQLDVTCDIYYT